MPPRQSLSHMCPRRPPNRLPARLLRRLLPRSRAPSLAPSLPSLLRFRRQTNKHDADRGPHCSERGELVGQPRAHPTPERERRALGDVWLLGQLWGRRRRAATDTDTDSTDTDTDQPANVAANRKVATDAAANKSLAKATEVKIEAEVTATLAAAESDNAPGKQDDTCPRCSKLFKTNAGLQYHWKNNICLRGKQRPLPLLLPPPTQTTPSEPSTSPSPSPEPPITSRSAVQPSLPLAAKRTRQPTKPNPKIGGTSRAPNRRSSGADTQIHCPLCDRCYFSAQGVRYHIQHHHGMSAIEATQLVSVSMLSRGAGNPAIGTRCRSPSPVPGRGTLVAANVTAAAAAADDRTADQPGINSARHTVSAPTCWPADTLSATAAGMSAIGDGVFDNIELLQVDEFLFESAVEAFAYCPGEDFMPLGNAPGALIGPGRLPPVPAFRPRSESDTRPRLACKGFLRAGLLSSNSHPITPATNFGILVDTRTLLICRKSTSEA